MRYYLAMPLKKLKRLSLQHFDIVVIGGGLVGASFARAIAGSGLKTLVIDRLPAHALYSDALDNRGLALSHTTQQALATLNCWDSLSANAYPIETVHISEQHSFGFTKLLATSHKIPALGYVVSASNLGSTLLNGLDDLDHLTVLRPAEIIQLEFDHVTFTWTLTLSDRVITARLLVAADGANSSVRAIQNIPMHTTHYQQTALVTNVGVNAKHLTTAYERFTANGVIALLPFGTQNLKCVWTAPNSIVAQLSAKTDAEFLMTLQEAFGFRLGKFTSISERKTFSICETHAEQPYGQGMVLIGNAANTLHPVAAQGFNLGIRDALDLAKILKRAKRDNLAINSGAVLQQYAQLRAKDHRNTRSFTNSLVNIFARENKLIKFSRRIGIVAAHFITPLNRKIIMRGQGL